MWNMKLLKISSVPQNCTLYVTLEKTQTIPSYVSTTGVTYNIVFVFCSAYKISLNIKKQQQSPIGWRKRISSQDYFCHDYVALNCALLAQWK